MFYEIQKKKKKSPVIDTGFVINALIRSKSNNRIWPENPIRVAFSTKQTIEIKKTKHSIFLFDVDYVFDFCCCSDEYWTAKTTSNKKEKNHFKSVIIEIALKTNSGF